MKKDIKNIEASVRALLQNKAKETNRPFAEVLQYYGMERFLVTSLLEMTKVWVFVQSLNSMRLWCMHRSLGRSLSGNAVVRFGFLCLANFGQPLCSDFSPSGFRCLRSEPATS